MDDRDQPDSNVVRLRRRGDPGEEERQRLASTIFAEEDEVGTFSRGNLLPPKQNAHGDEEAPAAPDPFFDELQNERDVSSGSTEGEPFASESTSAYFDQIDSQTPVEMSQDIPPLAAGSAMPGSAQLPGDIAKPSRRRRLRSGRQARPEIDERTPSSRLALRVQTGTLARELVRLPRRLRARTAQVRPARLAAVGIALLLATVAGVAAIVATQASGGASVKQSAAHRVNRARLALASHGHAAVTQSPVRRRVRHETSHARPAVRHRATRHSNEAAIPTHTTAAKVASEPTSTVASSGTAPQPVTQSPSSGGGSSSTQQSSGSSTQQTSGSSSNPSFGANGILGPGHSPNG